MSMLSLCTIGAIASKKASSSSPVFARICSAKASEVSGPVAMSTLPQSSSGSSPISSRAIVTFGCSSRAFVTASENPTRSTAKAPPAGTWFASADFIISEPAKRISACNTPTAFEVASSERNELEQTSSAKPSVWWASVFLTGRIS